MAEVESAPASTSPAMIEAVGLSKFYGVFTACRDVTFTVNQGEVVAFLGPNGAGKSTTMKMLTGYLAPSEGVSRISGHNMQEDRLAGSERLGYLPENGPLYPEMTPHSLLQFFAEARGMGPKPIWPLSQKRHGPRSTWAEFQMGRKNIRKYTGSISNLKLQPKSETCDMCKKVIINQI